jgi:hypoxanthine phosphoribosyltransferase
MPAKSEMVPEGDSRPNQPDSNLPILFEEWKESRATIDRLDKISVDLRKYGFSIITLIISSSSIIFDAARIQNPLPLIIVPFSIAILTLSLFLADNYYQVLLLSSILHARQLENAHMASLSQAGKGQIYYGLNLTNAVEDKVQKSRAHVYVFIVYLLFLLISFILGGFSMLVYEMNTHDSGITPYVLAFLGGYGIVILFIVVISRSVITLTNEMRKTELIDNRFVIRKVFEHAEVGKAIHLLAGRIYRMYKGRNFKILTLGMGGLYFANKLISELKGHDKVNVELISAFSERKDDEISIIPPEKTDLQGEDILIVDDLVSTGLTLTTAKSIVNGLGARSVKTCVLLDAYNKRHPEAIDLQLDLVGLRSPERRLFFVGSGLDGGEKMSDESADKCRSLPYIGVIVAP